MPLSGAGSGARIKCLEDRRYYRPRFTMETRNDINAIVKRRYDTKTGIGMARCVVEFKGNPIPQVVCQAKRTITASMRTAMVQACVWQQCCAQAFLGLFVHLAQLLDQFINMEAKARYYGGRVETRVRPTRI